MITKEAQKAKKIKTAFDKFDIKHVSVSSTNKFRDATDAWIASYLYKLKFPTGYAAIQGSSVEFGVDLGVYNDIDIDTCAEKAFDRFRTSTRMMPNQYDELKKREPIIHQMVRVALEQLEQYGKPEAPQYGDRQHKIEIPVRFKDGKNGTVPVIGYLDYWFPNHNLIIDLKTTSKSPSGWTLGHGIQASIYQRAMEKKTGKKPQVLFLYCLTRKKDPFVWLEMEEPEDFLNTFRNTVITMHNLLDKFDSKEEILSVVPHNPDSFYWSDGKHIAANLYGSPSEGS